MLRGPLNVKYVGCFNWLYIKQQHLQYWSI